MNYIKFAIIFLLISVNSNAQTADNEVLEDLIQSLFNKVIFSKNDEEKLNYNNRIEKAFAQVLSTKTSFEYPFDKLKHISKLSSADGLLRIITWNLPYTNGTYKYFGFVQIKLNDNDISLVKLNDNSKEILTPQSKSLNKDNWYGALYYKILTNKYKNKTFYTLLGWDGNDNFTNKKIIETLVIKRQKLQFGRPIIKMGKKTHNRIVFEYSKQAKMMLRYDEKKGIIVFDHLAPSLKKFEGQFMYYGPDLSQDGLKFVDGNWILSQNLDMRNKNKDSDNKPIKTSW